MKRMTFLLALLFTWEHAAGQVVSKNLSLASFVGYQTLYGSQPMNPSGEETIRDIASWRDARTGKEYALVCLPTFKDGYTGSGVALVEVTDPNNPAYVKTIQHPDDDLNTPTDVKVYNNFLFVAQNPQPTYWVDLTAAVDTTGNPTAGFKGNITFGSGISIHNLFVNKEQQLLFLSFFVADSSILVYDISGVPNTAPVFKGKIPQLLTGIGARSHDLYARKISATQGRVFDASLRAITVSDYTWSGGTFTPGTQRAHQYNPYRGVNPSDFSNPSKIMPLDNRIAHSTWLGAGSNYLFSNEEQFGGDTTLSTWISTSSINYKRGNYLYVWDISNIDASPDQNNFRYPIKQVYEVRENSDNGAFASPPNAYFSELSNEKANSIHNIVSRGSATADTLYAAYYTKGIRVLNATNPASMSELAYYDTPGVNQYLHPVYNGPWGVDPFLPSENILASSSDGLYVFRKTGVFSGTISVNTRWTNQITVIGNVTVANGVTLTVDSGTTVKFASGTSLAVNGTLTVNGTQTQLVTFDRSGTSGTWSGINFYSGSSGTVTYATIDHATKGVYVSGTNNVTIANCTIQNFTEQGVYATNSSVTVQNSTIQNPAGASHGIYLLGGSSNPTITGNTIEDALIGIERKDSPGAATISGNTFTNCGAGVKTISSSPQIYNNYFDGVSNADHGIRIGASSSPDIHDNDFFDYTVGVYLEQSEPANLKWNNFGYTGGQIKANEDRGIYINYLSSGNSFLNSKWNNFYDGSNGVVDVFNGTSTTLNAQGNYWYSQQIEGNVNSSNPQTSHNNDAGPGGGLGKIAAAGANDAIPIASTIPETFSLEQNFPNPFNPGTLIGFKLPKAAIVTLTIYDLLGRRVRTLISGFSYEPGFHNLTWDGTDDSGQTLTSGIYIYRIEAKSDHLQKSYSESRKLLFTR